MSQDPFDQYNNRPSHYLDSQGEEHSLARIDARIQATIKKPYKVYYWKVIAAAAAILMLVLMGKHLVFDTPDYTQLSARVFKPYPNYETLAVRGVNDDLSKAYAAYDKSDYENAAGHFARQSGTPVDQLYHGIALQALHEWEQSLAVLTTANPLLPEQYRQAGKWHAALAMIAIGQPGQAIPVVEALAEGQSEFAEEARALLRDLR